MKKLSTLMIIIGLTLSACDSGGPKTFGEELEASADMYQKAAAEWKRGQEMIAAGYKQIEEGQQLVNEGTAQIQTGQNTIRTGEVNVTNGRTITYQVEEFFRQSGMPFTPQQQAQ